MTTSYRTENEQHGLRALAQHGDGGDGADRGEAALAGADGARHLSGVGSEFRSVLRHPHVVPGQHQDCGTEHAGVEDLLVRAIDQLRKARYGKRDGNGADRARTGAAGEPAASPAEPARRRNEDAD